MLPPEGGRNRNEHESGIHNKRKGAQFQLTCQS